MSKNRDKTRFEVLTDMLHEIDRQGVDLTDWQKSFVDNLLDADLGFFTERQEEVIEKIYEERVR